MAIDLKYGQVTLERGNIAEDEPVIVFRAQDELLISVLGFYRDLCRESGSPDRHIDAIHAIMSAVADWQNVNFTKIPTSDSWPIA